LIAHRSQRHPSSLAAATRQDIGLVDATDVIGSFRATKPAGPPIRT
jgi:hypothetical protein